MDAPLELQDEVLQLDARQFNYRVVHRLTEKYKLKSKRVSATILFLEDIVRIQHLI